MMRSSAWFGNSSWVAASSEGSVEGNCPVFPPIPVSVSKRLVYSSKARGDQTSISRRAPTRGVISNLVRKRHLQRFLIACPSPPATSPAYRGELLRGLLGQGHLKGGSHERPSCVLCDCWNSTAFTTSSSG